MSTTASVSALALQNNQETSHSQVSILTAEEEDAIILARIVNDDRPIRRVLKKFHNYTALTHTPPVPPPAPSGNSAGSAAIEDARDAFLIELESFKLSLEKSVMICQAEARQAEEYLREKSEIDDEHGRLREHIEQLKVALEFAQMERRRKIEYDLVAERVNTLPTREELDGSIAMLENDIAAIFAEHDNQSRIIQQQKTALDGIISDLTSLRFIGKDRDATSTVPSPIATPLPDESVADGTELIPEGSLDVLPLVEDSEAAEGETGKALSEVATVDTSQQDLENDIEMGEVEEPEPKDNKTKKKMREELEEGEASDASSVLSDPPDD